MTSQGDWNELTKATQSRFLTMLAVSGYLGVSAATVRDCAMFSDATKFQLPILSVEVPPKAFLFTGAVLLLAVYVEFVTHLRRAQERLLSNESATTPRPAGIIGALIWAPRESGSRLVALAGHISVPIALFYLGQQFRVLDYWPGFIFCWSVIAIIGALASAVLFSEMRLTRLSTSGVAAVVIGVSGLLLSTPHKLRNFNDCSLSPAVNLSERVLRGASFDGARLRRCRLERADLNSATLDGAELAGVNLRGANLYFASLRETKLDRVSLKAADLRAADLTRAKITDTDLAQVRLDHANLSEAELTHARLAQQKARWVLLRRAKLSYADLFRTELENADLSRADLSWANLTEAKLQGAIMYDAKLEGAVLFGADLSGARLAGAQLNGANLTAAVLRGANLEGANLQGAKLEGAQLQDALLCGADLTSADVKKTNLRGARVNRWTRLPSGIGTTDTTFVENGPCFAQVAQATSAP